jgi:hypothetical protein
VRSADGEPDLLYIDLHLVHEVTSPQAFDGLRLTGRQVRRPDLTVATEDHNVPTADIDQPIADPVSRTQIDTLRVNTETFGVVNYPMGSPGQGIVHVIGPEQGYTLPGMTIVCGDSHTATHGAFGALAFGIGTSEVEHVFDFRGANAEREAGERPVRAGMRVAADHGHAGQRRTLLRPDHVHDALAPVGHSELDDAVLLAVLVKRLDLQPGYRVGDAMRAVGGGHIVISHGEIGGYAPRLAPGESETFERLRAGDFVDQMPVDIEQRRAVVFDVHHVGLPELVVESLSGHGEPAESGDYIRS